MRIKDKIYNHCVCDDPRIRYEYERYVIEHIDEHRLNRFRHWRLLLKLNWFYKVKKQAGPYIYFDDGFARIQRNDIEQCREDGVLSNPVIKNDAVATGVKLDRDSNRIARELFFKKYPSPYFFMKSLLQYDVISFDVFDTLVFRPFLNPYDLFEMLQKENHVLGFDLIRKKAARQASELNDATKGNKEITLDDIYKEICNATGIGPEEGKNNEMQLELDLCRPNDYMLQVFKLLRGQGKTIIAVSDMYLNKKEIQVILEKCGYCDLDEIFVSCEYNTGKASELFRVVKERYREKTIVHIGDNRDKDCAGANKNGIDSILYPNVNVDGIAHGKGMTRLVRSTYEGVVNYSLLNGANNHTQKYEYGFVYGGICALGFCNWIRKKSRALNADKVIFVSRDGFILEKIYREIFGEKNSKYVLWSRMAGLKLAPEYDKNTFVQEIIRKRRKDKNKCSVCEWMDHMGLVFLRSELIKYGLHENDPIIPENVMILEKMVSDNWDEVVKLYSSKDSAARKYWNEVIGDSSNILLVDIGWQGQSMLQLKWLLNKKWKIDCNISIAMFGACSSGESGNQVQIMDGGVDVYAFSQSFNKELYNFFKNSNNGRNKSVFELFFQAPHPSFDSYVIDAHENVNFRFAVPEVENYSSINQIHNGMYDFCKLYKEIFSDYDYMLNIDGADAIIPFMKVSADRKYLMSVLADMVFPLDSFFKDYELDKYKYSLII